MRVVSVSLNWYPRRETGSDGKTGQFWDLPGAATAVTVLEGHHAIRGSVKFSPDGKRMVTRSTDNTAGVWDTPPVEGLIPLARAGVSRRLMITQRYELGLPVLPDARQDREHIDPPPCP